MANLPDDLRHALDSAVSGVPVQKLALSVQRLIDAYRTPVPSRVLRHPQQGKGLVKLRLCTASGLESAIVSKRQAGLYRAARDLRWGDRWPPPPGT